MSVCCPEKGIINIKEGKVRPDFTTEGHYTLSYQPADTRAQALVCGPLGHEGVIAIRSLNHLARMLAKASVGSVRFDYKGTGESAGNQFAPDTMLTDRRAMMGYLPAAAVQGVIGAGFGAYPALFGSSSAENFLVLWDPVVNGREYAAKIRNDSKRHMFRRFLPWVPAELQGFTYPQNLLRQISEVNLLSLQQTVARRVLIVAQEQIHDIDPLADCLREQGSEVVVVRHSEELLGSGSLVTVPSGVIREIASWI